MPQWKRYLPIRLGTRPVQAGPGSWVLIPGYFQVWQLAKRKVLIIYNLSVGKLARSANSRPRWSDTPYLWPAPNFSQFLTLLDPPSKSLINQELCLIFLQFCQNNKRLCIECNLSLDGVNTSKTKCYFSERRKKSARLRWQVSHQRGNMVATCHGKKMLCCQEKAVFPWTVSFMKKRKGLLGKSYLSWQE